MENMQRRGSDSGCGDTGGGGLVTGPCMVKQFRFSEVHSPTLTQSYFKSYEVSHAHTTILGLVHLFILSFVTSNETLRRTFRVSLGWRAEKGGCFSNLRNQDLHRLKHGEKGAQTEPTAAPSHPHPRGVFESDNYSHKLRAFTRRIACCCLLVEMW